MRFRRELIWLIAGLASAIVLGAVGAECLRFYISNNGNSPTEQHQSGYRHISPLLGCADFRGGAVLSSLQEKIEAVIKSKKASGDISHASIYIRDLNNGPWLGINENEMFTPASLLKVPLMIAYLKEAETDPSIFDKEIMVKGDATLLSQNIMPQRSVETGKTYRLEDLLQYMIIYSDNLAANTLLENIETDKLNKVYKDLGLTEPSVEKTENFMMVRDYASFFRILYNASYLNREMSEKALDILTKSQFSLGLTAGVPSQVDVAHKFGERVLFDAKQLHDCGIVYKPGRPYLICVMTRGKDFTKMSTFIKDISAAAYQGL
ncbi:MAG: serine hydrolase [Bacillota bacterium]